MKDVVSNPELWKSFSLALLSGMAGCVLTLVVSWLAKLWQRHREFSLLKQGLYVDLTTAIDEIYTCEPTYSELYRQNEYRIDDSMLLSAKERLVRDFCDVRLLGRVSKALSSVRALNRLLDHYRDECLKCSEKNSAFVSCDKYVARLNCAVKGAFKQAISAMADLGSYADPKKYAVRIARIEKSRAQNIAIIKELSKEFANV